MTLDVQLSEKEIMIMRNGGGNGKQYVLEKHIYRVTEFRRDYFLEEEFSDI